MRRKIIVSGLIILVISGITNFLTAEYAALCLDLHNKSGIGLFHIAELCAETVTINTIGSITIIAGLILIIVGFVKKQKVLENTY